MQRTRTTVSGSSARWVSQVSAVLRLLQVGRGAATPSRAASAQSPWVCPSKTDKAPLCADAWAVFWPPGMVTREHGTPTVEKAALPWDLTL